MESLGGMVGVMAELAGETEPAQAVEARLAAVIDDLTAKYAFFDPARIIEIARLACLPWSWTSSAEADGGLARAELVALLAVTASNAPAATGDVTATDPAHTASHAVPASQEPGAPAAGAQAKLNASLRTNGELSTVVGWHEDANTSSSAPSWQPLTILVNEALPHIDRLLQLAQAREIVRTEPSDALGMIAIKIRGTEVWMRSTSYAEMAATTLLQLFANPQITAVLRADLGFDADQAVTVLESCHTLQVQQLMERMEQMAHGLDTARRPGAQNEPDPTLLAQTRQLWNAAWDAETDAVTVSIDDIVADTGLTSTAVAAILDYFRLDLATWSPHRAVDEFARGNNPLRTHPVIRTYSGRAMLVHNAHVVGAIRENLERHLKTTTAWESYRKARGDLLEHRTRAAFERVLPKADFRNGFEYYVPVNASEAQGNPSGYTKRVEGDHLIVQDDVAIIVEDKAVAVSPRSRAGETGRLRGDLTGIVKKASEQAGRLQDRIQQDGGVRLHGSGWLDLSHVREIHTVAVSLDDLPSVSTATAELVQAGLLDADHIPWTVCLHDLELIARLIELPAEFLLYLRRRRDPLATVMYTAPDELDLFLYFFNVGLYVEPDPDKVRELLPYMPAPTTAERRRYRKQKPTYLTSQTDQLDAWYRSTLASHAPADETSQDVAAEPGEVKGGKPKMASSQLRGLVASIQERGDYAWLSIGATLLSGASSTQAKLARIPTDLLANPWGDGRGRSTTVPFASDLENGWLLVWMTRPVSSKSEQDARDYLRAKKHQLLLPRGVTFVYDEGSKELVDVIYDGHVGALEPRLQERQARLQLATHLGKFPHPNGRRRPGSASARSRSTNKKKHR